MVINEVMHKILEDNKVSTRHKLYTKVGDNDWFEYPCETIGYVAPVVKGLNFSINIVVGEVTDKRFIYFNSKDKTISITDEAAVIIKEATFEEADFEIDGTIMCGYFEVIFN